MDLGRACFVILCVISCSVLMPRGWGRRQRTGELFLGSGDSSAEGSNEANEDVVKMEQVLMHCGLDPQSLKAAMKSSDFYSLKDKAVNCSMLKELLDCIIRKDTGGNNNQKKHADFTERAKSFFGWNSVLVRHLAEQPFEVPPAAPPRPHMITSVSEIFSSSPSTPPSPPPSPAPSPSTSPSPAPSPEVQPPSEAPSPNPDDGSYPAPSPETNFMFADSNSSPDEPPVLRPTNKDNNNKSIVVAVVVTAATTSLLVALLFICYRKCCRNRTYSGNWQRDERPLLCLSNMSDSSKNSYGYTNSISEDKIGSLSLKNNITAGVGVLSFETSSSLNSASGFPAKRTSNEPHPPSVAPAAAPPPPPPPPAMSKSKEAAPPVPSPPPPAPNITVGSRPPPPPPKAAVPPRPPPMAPGSSRLGPSPLGPGRKGDLTEQNGGSKTKLKPFFWDKVLANPDESMVWNQIKSGSFQFNEEMIESLFGYSANEKKKAEAKKHAISNDPSTQYIHLLDPKKSQNLAISVKALNVKIEEVCDALMEGNQLPNELLQMLLRMAPTPDEELKLRLYCGELAQLGPAEQFLKSVVDIPFAFKRMEALLFMATLQEDASEVKESFSTLEVACGELKKSRVFLKLLEAVLKTGNRMNDGTFRGGAQAFKLDTLLKLSDVKGTDGKTTLLHFVVQEIIRSEGVRAARSARESRSISNITSSSFNSVDLSDDIPQDSEEYYRNLGLKVVSCVGSELENVKKAASLDADTLTSMVANLGHRLVKTKEVLNKDMRSLEEDSGFHNVLKCFVEHAETEVKSLLEEEKRIRALVKSTTDYFHGNSSKDEGFRLFVIVRDFLGILDRACKEVRESANRPSKTPKHLGDNSKKPPVADPRERLFPAIRDRRMDSSSSDED